MLQRQRVTTSKSLSAQGRSVSSFTESSSFPTRISQLPAHGSSIQCNDDYAAMDNDDVSYIINEESRESNQSYGSYTSDIDMRDDTLAVLTRLESSMKEDYMVACLRSCALWIKIKMNLIQYVDGNFVMLDDASIHFEIFKTLLELSLKDMERIMIYFLERKHFDRLVFLYEKLKFELHNLYEKHCIINTLNERIYESWFENVMKEFSLVINKKCLSLHHAIVITS